MPPCIVPRLRSSNCSLHFRLESTMDKADSHRFVARFRVWRSARCSMPSPQEERHAWHIPLSLATFASPAPRICGGAERGSALQRYFTNIIRILAICCLHKPPVPPLTRSGFAACIPLSARSGRGSNRGPRVALLGGGIPARLSALLAGRAFSATTICCRALFCNKDLTLTKFSAAAALSQPSRLEYLARQAKVAWRIKAWSRVARAQPSLRKSRGPSAIGSARLLPLGPPASRACSERATC